MNDDFILQHYGNVAQVYNDLWDAPAIRHINQAVSRDIISYLAIEPADRVVDLGCGTGIYAKAIVAQVPLEQKLVCVDPSAEMLAQIPDDGRFETQCQDALTFARDNHQYDKLFMKGSFHHVEAEAWPELFGAMYHQLSERGRLLIIVTSPKSTPPLFQAAYDYLYQFAAFDSQPILQAIETAGFTVKETEIGYPVDSPKTHLFKMIRNRAMSFLSIFDDETIEQGIKEIDEKHPDTISFVDTNLFIQAIK